MSRSRADRAFRGTPTYSIDQRSWRPPSLLFCNEIKLVKFILLTIWEYSNRRRVFEIMFVVHDFHPNWLVAVNVVAREGVTVTLVQAFLTTQRYIKYYLLLWSGRNSIHVVNHDLGSLMCTTVSPIKGFDAVWPMATRFLVRISKLTVNEILFLPVVHEFRPGRAMMSKPKYLTGLCYITRYLLLLLVDPR